MKENNNIFVIDFRRSFKMFFKAAAITALAIPAAIIAGFAGGADFSDSRLAIASIPAFVGVIMYIVACFKLYHRYIFVEEDYMAQYSNISWEKLLLSKVAVGVIWLAALGSIMIFACGNAAWRILGQGTIGMISALSLLFQGALMLTILYLAATASHVKMFNTYKTLAGIFVLVATYALESDLILRMKILGSGLYGGIEKMFSGGILEVSAKDFSLEFVSTLLLISVNLIVTTYLLKYKLHNSSVENLLLKSS